MKTVHFSCPVAASALGDLKLGDLVDMDGGIFTGRERLYQRYLGEGQEPLVPIGDISNVNSPNASRTTFVMKYLPARDFAFCASRTIA